MLDWVLLFLARNTPSGQWKWQDTATEVKDCYYFAKQGPWPSSSLHRIKAGKWELLPCPADSQFPGCCWNSPRMLLEFWQSKLLELKDWHQVTSYRWNTTFCWCGKWSNQSSAAITDNSILMKISSSDWIFRAINTYADLLFSLPMQKIAWKEKQLIGWITVRQSFSSLSNIFWIFALQHHVCPAVLLSILKGGAISYSRKGWVTPERRGYGPYKLQEDKIPKSPSWRISSAHEQALVSACNNTDSDRWVELYETLTLLPGVNDRQVKCVSFLLFDPSLPTRELTIWSVVTRTEMAMCCYFGNHQGGWEGLLHGRGKVFNKCQSLSCSREESSIHFNAHPAFTVV